MSATEPANAHRTAPTEQEVRRDVAPAGEEIHLPGQSVLPLTTAIGITLTVIGTTVDWLWSVLGLIIFVVSVTIWIRSTRRDMSALPEEHHH